MGNVNPLSYLSTTGTAIAIGTGIQLGSVVRGSDLAGTIIILAGATILLTMSAERAIHFPNPIAISGPVTMTSSAGRDFIIGFVNK